MNYSERLKNLREEKDLKQYELAKILNINVKAYSMYETEYKIVPSKHLITLCEALNVSVDYLLGLSNDILSKNYVHTTPDLSASRLIEFRKSKKLTQEKLANILKTTQSVVSDWEKGKRFIPTLYLFEICKKYNVSADYILGRKDNPTL